MVSGQDRDTGKEEHGRFWRRLGCGVGEVLTDAEACCADSCAVLMRDLEVAFEGALRACETEVERPSVYLKQFDKICRGKGRSKIIVLSDDDVD